MEQVAVFENFFAERGHNFALRMIEYNAILPDTVTVHKWNHC
jgi:hypothetical protein